MTDSKPIVHFEGTPEFIVAAHPHPETGEDWAYARVHALDHPRLGCSTVRTSEVLKQYEDGSFETRNTFYRPAVLG